MHSIRALGLNVCGLLLFLPWGSAVADRSLPPPPLRGVTVDAIAPLKAIVTSLKRLSKRPTTRIVFDEQVPASTYVSAVRQIHAVSYVMGELLDSSAMKGYDVNAYASRTREYLDALGDTVDIWEVGNEVNGDWLGDTPSVVAKISAAYDLVKARGLTTELTLYYNIGCGAPASNEMFQWAGANVPERMRQGLDYVLVSWYEDDCNNLQPNWTPVFQRLATLFPSSRLGFGEVGTKFPARKAKYIKKYYAMRIGLPQFVGGFFWWYFRQDAVPYTKPLWKTMNRAMAGIGETPEEETP